MRGKPTLVCHTLFPFRITPADAGKTGFCTCGAACTGDHPRGCGENQSSKRFYALIDGSPPRMRGKPRRWCCEMFEYRITPADAGKTTSMDSTLKSPEDHPRGCGENTQSRKKLNARSGSPPRMRGKPADAATTPAPTRITPADAGKTGGAVSRRRYHQDHPRGCGENLYSEHYSVRLQGSPPRMRGKQGCC